MICTWYLAKIPLMIFQNCLKCHSPNGSWNNLRITILKYNSWYLCQISLLIMLLPILIESRNIRDHAVTVLTAYIVHMWRGKKETRLNSLQSSLCACDIASWLSLRIARFFPAGGLASSTELVEITSKFQPLPPPLVAVDVAYPQ